ncbi:hypothetical protein HMPREF1986_01378 [Oribacterium sp. oral taxon 078 str. F0263]|nr:hypothetical protein HMPREF1986_01378 [Oribacterium sp. oral taxon 078 str. F0263]
MNGSAAGRTASERFFLPEALCGRGARLGRGRRPAAFTPGISVFP